MPLRVFGTANRVVCLVGDDCDAVESPTAAGPIDGEDPDVDFDSSSISTGPPFFLIPLPMRRDRKSSGLFCGLLALLPAFAALPTEAPPPLEANVAF